MELALIRSVGAHDTALRMVVTLRPVVVNKLDPLLIESLFNLFPGKAFGGHAGAPSDDEGAIAWMAQVVRRDREGAKVPSSLNQFGVA